VREWLVEGGRCCSLFLHRLVLVASCCSLLAWCLSRVSCLVSRVCVRERESFISSSRVREWLVEGGRCCSLFLHRLVLVAWLLVACLLGLSRVSCDLFGLSSLELVTSLCRRRCERERLKWKRWETMLLIVMLESSSRSAPSNMAMPMASSTFLEAWRSTIIEISCSSSIAETIECKYSRVMMMMADRSCPSSASMVTNQASS